MSSTQAVSLVEKSAASLIEFHTTSLIRSKTFRTRGERGIFSVLISGSLICLGMRVDQWRMLHCNANALSHARAISRERIRPVSNCRSICNPTNALCLVGAVIALFTHSDARDRIHLNYLRLSFPIINST